MLQRIGQAEHTAQFKLSGQVDARRRDWAGKDRPQGILLKGVPELLRMMALPLCCGLQSGQRRAGHKCLHPHGCKRSKGRCAAHEPGQRGVLCHGQKSGKARCAPPCGIDAVDHIAGSQSSPGSHRLIRAEPGGLGHKQGAAARSRTQAGAPVRRIGKKAPAAPAGFPAAGVLLRQESLGLVDAAQLQEAHRLRRELLQGGRL